MKLAVEVKARAEVPQWEGPPLNAEAIQNSKMTTGGRTKILKKIIHLFAHSLLPLKQLREYRNI